MDREQTDKWVNQSMRGEAAPGEIAFAGGGSSSHAPRFDLIPRKALIAFAGILEEGVRQKGEFAYNALSNNQDVMKNRDFIINRLAVHGIDHITKAVEEIVTGVKTGENHAGAIMFAGMCLACANLDTTGKIMSSRPMPEVVSEEEEKRQAHEKWKQDHTKEFKLIMENDPLMDDTKFLIVGPNWTFNLSFYLSQDSNNRLVKDLTKEFKTAVGAKEIIGHGYKDTTATCGEANPAPAAAPTRKPVEIVNRGSFVRINVMQFIIRFMYT